MSLVLPHDEPPQQGGLEPDPTVVMVDSIAYGPANLVVAVVLLTAAAIMDAAARCNCLFAPGPPPPPLHFVTGKVRWRAGG